MKKLIFILAVFAFLVNCASTIKSPNVGDNAPNFSVVDVSGNDVRLSDFKGKKNVVLFFYEDYGWQPCVSQLGELQKIIGEIEKLNAQLIAISTAGNQKDVELTKKSLGISYILIPTPNRKVGQDFNLTYDRGAAFATIIIDKKGNIRYRGDDSWDRRTSVSRIIKELQALEWFDILCDLLVNHNTRIKKI